MTSDSGVEAIDAMGETSTPLSVLLANVAVAAATGVAAILCGAIPLPLWSVLLGAVVFFSGGLRLRDGAASFACLAIGTVLGAGTGLAIGALTPLLAGAAFPLAIFGITLLVLSLQNVPVLNNMLAYYLGLIEFVAFGEPPGVWSVGTLIASGALGGALAIVSLYLERRIRRPRMPVGSTRSASDPGLPTREVLAE